MTLLGYGLTIWIFLIGIYGIVTSHHLVHLVVSLSVSQTATYVLLLMIGFRQGATAPVFADIPIGTPAVDPIVQALMLTDIVVGVTFVALLLALAVQAHKRTGEIDPDKLRALRG